jgi:hypothetical protein
MQMRPRRAPQNFEVFENFEVFVNFKVFEKIEVFEKFNLFENFVLFGSTPPPPTTSSALWTMHFNSGPKYRHFFFKTCLTDKYNLHLMGKA